MTESSYAQVARAKREADAIEEAFRAILRADFLCANRCLARAQSEHYGLKPWRPGVPSRDAIGNEIVFLEDHWRYTIPLEHENHDHVRTYMTCLHDLSVIRTFEAWAASEADAKAIGLEYAAARHPRLDAVPVGIRHEGWVVLKFELRERHV